MGNIIITGEVATDASTQTFPSGKSKTTVCIKQTPVSDDRKPDLAIVSAWNEEGKALEALKKSDEVVLEVEYKKPSQYPTKQAKATKLSQIQLEEGEKLEDLSFADVINFAIQSKLIGVDNGLALREIVEHVEGPRSDEKVPERVVKSNYRQLQLKK